MSAPIKTVVVHGATGRQGGSVVRTLAAAGFKFRAAVRDPDAPKARELAAIPGVELVTVNLDDVQTLVAAYQGADAVFGLTVPSDDEVTQGKNMADAAKAAGVRHFVWSGLESVQRRTKGEMSAKFFDDKALVSDYIASIGLPATILLLGAFMENYVYFPGYCTVDEDSTIVLTMGPGLSNIKFPMLRAEKDTGEAVRIILSHPDAFAGQEVVIGHHLLTVEEQADIVAKISGRKARAGPPMSFPTVPEVEKMYSFCNDPRFGMYTDRTIPDPLLEKYGFKPATFEGFVREHLLPHLGLQEA
ncbi:NAD(P)-binding protein [Auricularia subglabra TFB-10046 SS5]|nr:NAD(P)-binding protein [Auricularia subglabra TFB-10046 SS5]